MIEESWPGRFFQLLVHLPSFSKAVCAAGKGSKSKHRAEACDPGAYDCLADRSGAGFYSGFGYADDLAVLTLGLKAFSAPLPARGCSGTCKVDCRGKMISEASPWDQV